MAHDETTRPLFAPWYLKSKLEYPPLNWVKVTFSYSLQSEHSHKREVSKSEFLIHFLGFFGKVLLSKYFSPRRFKCPHPGPTPPPPPSRSERHAPDVQRRVSNQSCKFLVHHDLITDLWLSQDICLQKLDGWMSSHELLSTFFLHLFWAVSMTIQSAGFDLSTWFKRSSLDGLLVVKGFFHDPAGGLYRTTTHHIKGSPHDSNPSHAMVNPRSRSQIAPG